MPVHTPRRAGPENWALPFGTVMGAGLGLVLGLVLGPIALGLGVGAALGTVAGAVATAALQIPADRRWVALVSVIAIVAAGAAVVLLIGLS